MSRPIDCTAIDKEIKGVLSEKRYLHSVSVAETDLMLAKQYGEDYPNDVLYGMGLLHDRAREWDEKDLRDYVTEHEVPLEKEEWFFPPLLHGPVEADILLREGYDEEIARAVRWHTLGSVTMGRLGLILFISDYLEPRRTHIDQMERALLLSQPTLEKCCIALLKMQDAYHDRTGKKNAAVTNQLERYLLEGKRL